ncbi:hypothetical protein, partial [Escherichia coli]|uniref:hypothetical protein n=1 Tax=Escherichia coli TaxID=562 RepID=UPI001BC852DD
SRNQQMMLDNFCLGNNKRGEVFFYYRFHFPLIFSRQPSYPLLGVSLEIGNFCTLSALFNQLSYAASSYRL